MASLTATQIVRYWRTKNLQVVQLDVAANDGASKCLMYALKQIDDAADFKSNGNKDSLSADGMILHNMYSMDKIWYHGQAARRHRYIYETEYDYQHVYRRPTGIQSNLSTTLCCCAQAQDTLYLLDKPVKFGHSFVNDYMYDWLANNNGFATPRTRVVDTTLYTATSGNLSDSLPESSVAEALSACTSDTYFMESELSNAGPGIYATSALVGVQYSTVYEIPNIVQDYDKGELIANTFKTKSQFDGYTWSMTKGPGSNDMLSNARQYLGIYSCGSQIWLKWKDDIRYTSSGGDLSSDIFQPQYVISANATPTVYYPQVEVIDAINRGIQEPGHKSSLYALKLKTRLLEKFAGKAVLKSLSDNGADADDIRQFSETFKTNMKTEIQNCIRKIAERIAPVGCQLFSVTIEG